MRAYKTSIDATKVEHFILFVLNWVYHYFIDKHDTLNDIDQQGRVRACITPDYTSQIGNEKTIQKLENIQKDVD